MDTHTFVCTRWLLLAKTPLLSGHSKEHAEEAVPLSPEGSGIKTLYQNGNSARHWAPPFRPEGKFALGFVSVHGNQSNQSRDTILSGASLAATGPISKNGSQKEWGKLSRYVSFLHYSLGVF